MAPQKHEPLIVTTGPHVLILRSLADDLPILLHVDNRPAFRLCYVEALVEAGLSRLRPILMTSLTTALGLLPMAAGFGEGSEVRAPMAITVIGGLVVSTLLTLVVIPVVYSLMDRKRWPVQAQS